MLRFRAPSFAVSMTLLGRVASMVEMASVAFPEDEEADRSVIRHALKEAEPLLSEIPLSRVIKSQFERLQKSSQTATGKELSVLVKELHNNICVELTECWFLMIPATRREYYEQRQQPFGDKAGAVFADANKDIAAASRCLALDEWTASVFHLMRVLEHGLRNMAQRVGLSADAMEHENWKNVIDQIEKKIREMESEKKTPEKIARVQFLSEAAAQFRYFKDAWRNHVSHSRTTYDERDAALIWTHVKAFIEHLAENP